MSKHKRLSKLTAIVALVAMTMTLFPATLLAAPETANASSTVVTTDAGQESDVTNETQSDTAVTDETQPDADVTDETQPDADVTDETQPDADVTDETQPDADVTDETQPDADVTDDAEALAPIAPLMTMSLLEIPATGNLSLTNSVTIAANGANVEPPANQTYTFTLTNVDTDGSTVVNTSATEETLQTLVVGTYRVSLQTSDTRDYLLDTSYSGDLDEQGLITISENKISSLVATHKYTPLGWLWITKTITGEPEVAKNHLGYQFQLSTPVANLEGALYNPVIKTLGANTKLSGFQVPIGTYSLTEMPALIDHTNFDDDQILKHNLDITIDGTSNGTRYTRTTTCTIEGSNTVTTGEKLDNVTIVAGQDTNVTFTNNYSDPTKHNVTYAWAGTAPEGVTLPAIERHKQGTAFALPTIQAPAGWTFNGWDASVTNGQYTMPTNDVTITGTWTYGAPKDLTLSYVWANAFAPADAALPESVMLATGDTITIAANPTTQVRGWTFAGWDTAALGDGNTMPAQDAVITGTWTYRNNDDDESIPPNLETPGDPGTPGDPDTPGEIAGETTIIADGETPLAGNPFANQGNDPQRRAPAGQSEPNVTIDENETPLAALPSTVNIDENPTPLAAAQQVAPSDDGITIIDNAVPLGMLPKTGGAPTATGAMVGFLLMGMALPLLLGNKRTQKGQE